MNEKKRVHIGELYAELNHHFPFKLGDEVTVSKTGKRGTVEDAVWEGKTDGFFTVTYYVVAKDGEKLEVKMQELEDWNK